MADYKFDGKELRDRRGSKIGALDGKYIRDGHGSSVGEIDNKYFRDSHGSRLAEFDGKDIRDSHGSRIATINDIKSLSKGPEELRWLRCGYSSFDRPAIMSRKSDQKKRVRLVMLSDTHGCHREVDVPGGDILIHAGDFTLFSKSLGAIEDFNA